VVIDFSRSKSRLSVPAELSPKLKVRMLEERSWSMRPLGRQIDWVAASMALAAAASSVTCRPGA